MPGGFFGLLEQEQVVPLQNCSQDSLTWDLAGRGSGHGKNLMANPAAYSGLRWGELIALTIPQVRVDRVAVRRAFPRALFLGWRYRLL